MGTTAAVYVAGALMVNILSTSGDFPTFYTAGATLLRGLGPRLYDPAVQAAVQRAAFIEDGVAPEAIWILLPFFLPPFAALPFVPLALVTMSAAYAVWGVLSVVMIAAAAQVAVRGEGWPARWRWAAVALALTYFPVVAALRLGQVSPPLLLCVALGGQALLAGRAGLAGAWLAVALFKPQYALVNALFLGWRRPRLLISFGAVACVLSAVSLAIVGPTGAWEYARALAQIASPGGIEVVVPGVMTNWRGVMSRLVGSGPAGLIWPLTAAADAVTLALVALLWRLTTCDDRSARLARSSAVVLASLLVSPHANPHDASLLVLPGCWIAALARRGAVDRAGWGLLAAGHLLGASVFVVGLRLYGDVTVAVAGAALAFLLAEARDGRWRAAGARGLDARAAPALGRAR